jgi:hypothetical protein
VEREQIPSRLSRRGVGAQSIVQPRDLLLEISALLFDASPRAPRGCEGAATGRRNRGGQPRRERGADNNDRRCAL